MVWAHFLRQFEQFLFDIDEIDGYTWNDGTEIVFIRKDPMRETVERTGPRRGLFRN